METLRGSRSLRITDPNGIIFASTQGHVRRSAQSARFPLLLKTLGHPALHRAEGALAEGLRRKDLALLVYLCVEGLPVHARGRLAALLWGESPEERARHSLTQALGRLSRVLPPGTLAADKDAVRWTSVLPCDAVVLLRDVMEPEEVDDAFSLYPGHFLEGFDPGAGAQDFREWADRRRAELRNAALRLLERAGAKAEDAGDFARALRLGERAVEIDPVWEQGHRRVMRALAARGERNHALRHYLRLETYLREEVGGRPDPDTRALAEQLRAPAPEAGPTPPPPPPSPPPTPMPTPGTSEAASPGAGPTPGAETARAADVDPDPPGPLAPPPPPRRGEDAPAGRAEPRPPAGRMRDRVTLWVAVILAGVVLALAMAIARERRGREASPAEPPPTHGENVLVRGERQVYLVFGDTLYAYPDWSTVAVCTGWHKGVVREVRALPPWPRRALPSVLRHGWMGGHLPVVSDDPQRKTVYVPVGCILPGVPNPETLDSIFGSDALGRMLEVPDSVLRRLPRAFVARGHPLRPAGTLLRGPDGRIRWITYHGGALAVPDPSILATYCRSADEAISVGAAEFAYYRTWTWLRPSRRACPRPTRRP